MSTRPRVRWWRLVDWRVVAAAGLPVWAVAIGFVAWDKIQQRSRPTVSVVATPSPVVPTPVAVPTPASPEDPAAESPDSRVIVVPYPVPQPVKAVRPAREVPFWLRDETGESTLEPDAAAPPGEFQTHGTAVKFVKSPTEAMSRARREDKLVCVLHLSGNLEDDGFT